MLICVSNFMSMVAAAQMPVCLEYSYALHMQCNAWRVVVVYQSCTDHNHADR